MSESGDRDRGGRRRPRRRGGGPGSGGRKSEKDYEADPQPAKPPIILAKPSHEQSSSQSPSIATSSSSNKQQEKTVVMVRSREDSYPSAGSTSSNTSASSGETTPAQPVHSLHRNPVVTVHSDGEQKLILFVMLLHYAVKLVYIERHSRLVGPPEMSHCIRLVDESQNWNEAAMEMLVDQTDFFVVGVLGLQGTGKSTIMSLLAGNSSTDNHRQYIFQPQTRELREVCEHQTSGIEMYISGERTIFLDTQPILSASVLDKLIRHDKKIPPEYSAAENCVEMQSLHQAAFLMTVCHIILVVQDWFTDLSLLRFLQTAEMLKPSSPSPSHDSSSNTEESSDYFPHIVFIQNKATRDDFSSETYHLMQSTLEKVFDTSKLKYKGDITIANGHLVPGLSSRSQRSDVNLYLLPQMDNTKKESQETVLTLLPEYRGYPSFTTLVNGLRKQVYSMPRETLTHTTLSEKNWFHYAARTWDAVKKSQLMAEYNRLLN